KKGENMKKLILIVTVVVVSFALLQADVYIKQKTKTGAFMGQPAKELIQETWLGTNKMASISDEMSMIVNLAEKKVYMVMHKSKNYVEAALPLDITKLMPEQMAPMIKQMMDGMTISVKPNGQTKKVLNWNAEGYDVNMKMMGMDMKMTFWASKDVPFNWKKYSDLYTEVYKAQFRVGEKFMEEFKKIDGFPVLTEISMMGMDINIKTMVEEITKKTPGPGVYSVPDGYKKTDKLPMQGM
ncbi:MAG: hypothetical protein JSV88_14450, partial [Candidatus Aminicenantes bacterium]